MLQAGTMRLQAGMMCCRLARCAAGWLNVLQPVTMRLQAGTMWLQTGPMWLQSGTMEGAHVGLSTNTGDVVEGSVSTVGSEVV